MPDPLLILLPPGADRFSRRSGTPEILAVKPIDPADIADRELPEGAIITESDSITSTYSSFDVCRTFDLRQGMAGPVFRSGLGLRLDCCLPELLNAGAELQ